MRVISIISLKGGVAKTTTSVNMAYILCRMGRRVLLIDNDKQGNASKTFGLYDPDDKDTVARIMLDRDLDVREIIKATPYSETEKGTLDIITANMDLLEANLRTIVDTGRQQQTRFKKALAAVSDNYDYCIIDNAPDINMSIINALVVSDDLIIPIMIDQYSFGGLEIEQRAEVLDSGYPIFKSRIRRTENKVNESTFAGKPVVEYSVRCGASQDYKKFVNEYLEAIG